MLFLVLFLDDFLFYGLCLNLGFRCLDSFLFFGLFRILGELTNKLCDCTLYMEITYAVVGGVFLLLGALLWSKRLDKETETGVEAQS